MQLLKQLIKKKKQQNQQMKLQKVNKLFE
jgi:hypothetical protein